MPAPSDKTAWDFLPQGWKRDDQFAIAPEGFSPVTQLEAARLGMVTNEMVRVAEREPHLSAEQVRSEVAAGRLIIPANKVHLGFQLDPMAIGRASKTKINANMGASPVSSSTNEEVEKLHWSVRWGADTVMGPVDGRQLGRMPRSDRQNEGADRHGAHLLDDHRSQDRRPDRGGDHEGSDPSGQAGRRLLHPSTLACSVSTCPSCRSA